MKKASKTSSLYKDLKEGLEEMVAIENGTKKPDPARVHKHPRSRAGWTEAAKACHEAGEDKLADWEITL